jgi:hypothetical protein
MTSRYNFPKYGGIYNGNYDDLHLHIRQYSALTKREVKIHLATVHKGPGEGENLETTAADRQGPNVLEMILPLLLKAIQSKRHSI